jgi:hypothetical protein
MTPPLTGASAAASRSSPEGREASAGRSSSSAAGSPCPGYGAPAATKAAVEALTRVLALQLCARDITVNAVALQLDGPCTPGRVADAIAYVLSGDGRSSTGRVIRTDVSEADEYRTSATS